MAEVVIVFNVNYCRDDCPFCYFDENNGWFCSQLTGRWDSVYAIKDMNSKPLKDCPYRKE